MQARNKRRAVDFLAAAGPVTESDDVGPMLFQTTGERDLLGVVRQRDESFVAVGVIAHQDGQLSAGYQRAHTVFDEKLIPLKKGIERRSPRQVAWVIRVKLLPPVRRMYPAKLETLPRILRGVAGIRAFP